MTQTTVELKKHYLGDVYPGQEICECLIDIAENAVYVCVRRSGKITRTRFIDTPSAVEAIKSKLRQFIARRGGGGRWVLRRGSKPGYARLYIYYPSLDWSAGMRNPRKLVLGPHLV